VKIQPVRVLVYDNFGRLSQVVEINDINDTSWQKGTGNKRLFNKDKDKLTDAIVEAYETRS
jgi:hypothetical protein